MTVVATNRIAGVSDAILVQIAKFVAGGGLCDAKGACKEGVVERVRQLCVMSGTSKHVREITVDAARQALAFVMRLAPPQFLSAKALITSMRTNPDLAQSLLLQNKSVQASSACTHSEAVALSRLVELSKASARAMAAIAGADKFRADDSEKAARASDAEKMLEIAVRYIDSARPALRASLARATVGTGPIVPQR